MIKGKKIWIKIKTKNINKLILKLNELKVAMYTYNIFSDYIIVKINKEDYEIVNKYLLNYEVSIHKYIGIDSFFNIIKKYILYLLSIIIGLLMIFTINNMVFKININTDNLDIKRIINKELNKNNMGLLSLKKRHNIIEKIVKEIVRNNEDVLEWIEIEYKGVNLNVYVTEKINYKDKLNNNYCNIIAKKDSKIISILVKKGTREKEINDYVLKDDIIINGLIKKDEEIKNTTCADGVIYGEVWYRIKINMPLKEHYREYTGKKRYNIRVTYNNKEKIIFRERIKNYSIDRINIYTLNNFKIDLVKEKEYINKTKVLNNSEALEKAKELGLSKIEKKLNKDEKIITNSVLKKEINNNTIYLELFIVTKENIGYQKVINNS